MMKHLKYFKENLEDFKDLQLTPQEYKKLEGKYIVIEYLNYQKNNKGEINHFLCKVLNVSFYDFRFNVEYYQYEDDMGGYGALNYTYNYNDMKIFKIIGIFDSFKEANDEIKKLEDIKKFNV